MTHRGIKRSLRSGGRLLSKLFALSLVMALSGCSYVSSDWIYYKIILEVEADGKIYSGHSVNGQRFVGPKFWGATTNFVRSEKPTEAAFVDIGKHGTLFALLPLVVNRNGGIMRYQIDTIPKRRFLKVGDRGLREENVEKLNKLKGQGRELSCLTDAYTDEYARWLDCPLMVRFGDINDPTSVQKVDPKDLAAHFGEGVKLRSVRVEITDGPVSRKIHKKLPWLKNVDKLEEITEDVRDAKRGMGWSEAVEQGILTFPMTVTSGYFEQGHANDRSRN